MSRGTPEWVGKDDDSAVPARVRLRIFERYKGVCYLSGIKIRPGDAWELEHVVALCNGGAHAEHNLAPPLVAPHKIKTRADRRVKAKNDRVRKRHLGIRKPSRFPGSRDSRLKKKIDGTVVLR